MRSPLLTRRVLILALFTAILGVLAWRMTVVMSPQISPVLRRQPPGRDLPVNGSAPASDSPISLASSDQMQPTAGKKLTASPGGLPLYRTAKQIIGYDNGDRAPSGGQEQTAVYSLGPKAVPGEVFSFYERAMTRLGFRDATPKSTDKLTRFYVNDSQMVMFTLHEAPTDVRLTVIVRYTK